MRIVLIFIVLIMSNFGFAADRPLFGYLVPLKPTSSHCEFAQTMISEIKKGTIVGYTAHLDNAGGCAFYDGNYEAAIELWSKAYSLGVDRSLEPLARVMSLAALKKDRLLGTALLRAFIEQNKEKAYLLPLFFALQEIKYAEDIDKNEVFDLLDLAHDIEVEQQSFVTMQILFYLQKIEYFSAGKFDKHEQWSVLKKKLAYEKVSFCYIAEAIEYDMYKLPTNSDISAYFKSECKNELETTE